MANYNFSQIFGFASLALSNIIGGVVFGLLLDKYSGKEPLFTIVFSILGLVLALVFIIKKFGDNDNVKK